MTNMRATETVLFAGTCARVRETSTNPPFLADQSASRKMTTSKQKVFCVLRFAKTESAITVQRAFRIKFDCQSPNDNNILWWYHQFETTVCLCKDSKSITIWVASDLNIDCRTRRGIHSTNLRKNFRMSYQTSARAVFISARDAGVE
ncbi:DUF4817 domain-containing protein [Trichonephila clavipes]|nr:DUF4817 domain-containing protein [Trichonephila clavipes]